MIPLQRVNLNAMTRNHLQNSANGNFHGNRIRDAAGFFFFGEHTKYKIASGQLHGRVNFAPLSQATQFSWLENESGPPQTFPGPRLGSSGGGTEGALSKIRNISHAGNSPPLVCPWSAPFVFYFFLGERNTPWAAQGEPAQESVRLSRAGRLSTDGSLWLGLTVTARFAD